MHGRIDAAPEQDELWFLPLGGCGEIGMNMNLYGTAGKWLMVDCGITFADPGDTGPHVQMADPQFIAQRRDQLVAILITHAHEDHIGAVAHLWSQLGCPVFATPFAAAILRRKLSEAALLEQVPLHEVRPGQSTEHGPFQIEWLDLTHSTPESQGLLITTAVGSVFHTGDWKLDADPVVGAAYAVDRVRALGEQQILAMVCDSTNAMSPGWSHSEGELYANLSELISAATGRVVVCCFGSNVARLVTVARIAHECGRYPGLMGRSLHNYHAAAVSCGLWPGDLAIADSAHLGYLPRQEVLGIATGSQGEPRAALTRLAAGRHPDLDLEPGDLVIMSSRTIPGNEAVVDRLVRDLQARGVRVVQDEQLNRPIHASGHPCAEEVSQMYQWVRPLLAVPVHGEPEHMQANAELAKRSGVGRQLTGSNGDLFMFAPSPGIRRQAAPVGRLGLDPQGLVKL